MQLDHHPYADLRLESATFANPRRNTGLGDEEIRELALHIGRHGLRVPLTVTEDKVITAGQRRYLAIGMLVFWRETLFDQVAPTEREAFDARAAELEAAVPCTREDQTAPTDVLAAAIADNLQRSDMSTYDIAEQVVLLHGRGLTMYAIAEKIGRSRSYISELATAWRGACAELKDAWAAGMSYHKVVDLAALPPEAQRLALAPPDPEEEPAGRRRGPHGRPGVEANKAMLLTLKRRLAEAPSDRYLAGLVDALRVVTGAAPPSLVMDEDEPVRPEPTHPAMVTSYDEVDS